MASVESFVCWETKKERQQHVATLHSRGVSQTNCAHRLKVSRQTILRDYKELGLTTWSDVSDETLEKHVRTIMAVEHDAVGLHKIESHLLQRFGLRIQEKRIRGAMVSELQVLICQFSSQATLLSPLRRHWDMREANRGRRVSESATRPKAQILRIASIKTRSWGCTDSRSCHRSTFILDTLCATRYEGRNILVTSHFLRLPGSCEQKSPL